MIDLILDDCMNVMKDYEDNHFDLAIVDPPYGINAAKMTMGKGSRNDTKKNKLKDWDNAIPDKQYFDELFRVSKKQVIWGGNYFLDFLGYCKAPIIWDKLNGGSMYADGEMAWTGGDNIPRNLKIFKLIIHIYSLN